VIGKGEFELPKNAKEKKEKRKCVIQAVAEEETSKQKGRGGQGVNEKRRTMGGEEGGKKHFLDCRFKNAGVGELMEGVMRRWGMTEERRGWLNPGLIRVQKT